MKVVLSWLRELCPVDLSADALGELLSAKGMHTESIERPWEGLEGVVIARVLEVADHPDSGKLCLVRVDVAGIERHVVAGVRNMRPGDLVPYAGPGSRVPGLAEPLGIRTLRGERSEGMVCSARELALSGDHSGILVLPADAPVGADVKATFGLDDAVLDLEIEANRPDELSMIGIAREVSAATGVPWTRPEVGVTEGSEAAEGAASVRVLDPDRCPRFVARVVVDLTTGPSPISVQARLTAAGMRPVSSVVDATNYAMLELGQPMHPYDLARLAGRGVIVRRAVQGERLVTLDDVERTLSAEDLVIADDDAAVGIAGVMGSAASEVSASTREVLLESAFFAPRFVMRTSRRLLLQTEASTRFSRGADPELPGPAASRAARLMVDWGSGTVLRGEIEVGAAPARRRLVLRPARASLLLGYPVGERDAIDALGGLEIATEPSAQGELSVEVPSHRPDLELEADLIEEVVRAQGYDRMPSSLPGIRRAGGMVAAFADRARIRESLVRAGLREALSLSFASHADLALMGDVGAVRVANPPAADEPFLRTSLIPNLLKALARNLSRGRRGAALFEVGHVFRLSPTGGEPPAEEREAVAGALTGPAGEGLHAPDRDLDFLDAKGVVESLLASFGVSTWGLGDPPGPPFHPGRSAVVMIATRPAGVVGELHPRAAEAFGIPGRVAVFEFDASALAAARPTIAAYREIPRFPPVRRDLAFIVPAQTPAGAVRDAIMQQGGELLDTVLLFDAFEGEPIPVGRKNLAFSLEIRSHERTLTDPEADAAVRAIVEHVERTFGAELRSG